MNRKARVLGRQTPPTEDIVLRLRRSKSCSCVYLDVVDESNPGKKMPMFFVTDDGKMGRTWLWGDAKGFLKRLGVELEERSSSTAIALTETEGV